MVEIRSRFFLSIAFRRPDARLQSSRLVAISKSTGEIVDDGLANDEG